MDFRDATNELCEGISHDELAKALKVSVASVRQARLRADAKAHRSPPDQWEGALISLADAQIKRYRQLISELYAAQQKPLFDAPKQGRRA